MVERALANDREPGPVSLEREIGDSWAATTGPVWSRRSPPRPGGPVERIAARRGRGIVLLPLAEVWAFEASERLCFVHSLQGRFDVDSSLHELEELLGERFFRVHRKWLASLECVRAFEGHGRARDLIVGTGLGARDDCIRVPVSRELATAVRARLLVGCVGLRLALRVGA